MAETILATIEHALQQAQKERDELVVSTLRLVVAAVKNFAIEQKRRELTDEDVLKILKREVKKRQEAADLYATGGRSELQEKELKELAIINAYLPPGPSETDITQAIDAVAVEQQTQGPLQFGRLMGETMKRLGPGASGDIVKRLVQARIAGS